jgi:uncharacterized membrane protein YfcA
VQPSEVAAICILIFAAAILYSSVGHAGASGYIAVMALFGVAVSVMKPTALTLNIIVASIAVLRFMHAGYFSWRTLWPFLIGSIPLAFIGGAIQLPSDVYRPVVGAILLLAAGRLLITARSQDTHAITRDPPVVPAAASGGVIGVLSGLTGTGGGIFLSPLLLFTGWAETRESAGVSAAFILANSLAGLAGHVSSVQSLPGELPLFAIAAALGGLIGTELGVRRFAASGFRLALAGVLTIAAFKLILT